MRYLLETELGAAGRGQPVVAENAESRGSSQAGQNGDRGSGTLERFALVIGCLQNQSREQENPEQESDMEIRPAGKIGTRKRNLQNSLDGELGEDDPEQSEDSEMHRRLFPRP